MFPLDKAVSRQNILLNNYLYSAWDDVVHKLRRQYSADDNQQLRVIKIILFIYALRNLLRAAAHGCKRGDSEN